MLARGLKLIHFVDQVDDNKWSQLCDSIYEWKSPGTVEILNSIPDFGEKILEIGCSTGQVTEYLGHYCAEVLALDTSPSMLLHAQKRIQQYVELTNVSFQKLQDFAVFPQLDRKFDQILMLNSCFTAITDVQDQKRYLSDAHDVLVNGGQLIICIDMMKMEAILRDPSSNYHLVEVRNCGGEGSINISEQVDYDEFSQLCETVLSADFIADDGIVFERYQRRIVSRYMHVFEMVHLLKLCGFTVEGVFGDFYGNALSDEANTVIWVAQA